MIWRNTTGRYGVVAQGFHWVVGLCVIGLLIVGLLMTEMKPGPDMFKVCALHKSVGIVVLSLAVLRLIWKLSNPKLGSLPTHQKWEKFLAHLTHLFLYFAMIGMPLSGWIMSSAKGFPVSVFGWFTLPDLVGTSAQIGKLANQFHELTAYALIAAIALHFAGAMKHHVIDKDSALRRMIPGMMKKEEGSL